MFDWDQDFDAVVAPSAIAVGSGATLVKTGVPPGQRVVAWLRGGRGRLALPLVVMLAVGVGLASGLSSGVTAAWAMVFEVRMPEGLRVYDQSQFTAFRRGISRFTDAELLEYERSTLGAHAAAEPLLADFSHDVLVLIHQEIQRRGLSRPVSSLRFRERRPPAASPQPASPFGAI